MKVQVTVYKRGQIASQFEVVTFKKALSVAAHELGKQVEHYTLGNVPVKVETSFLSKTEWTCTLFGRLGEEFGITVEQTK